MGETAPLVVTALSATYVNWDITKPTSAISLLIWEFYNDPNSPTSCGAPRSSYCSSFWA